ncbi:MAG: glycosyltransferase family 39 protein, partial [Thermodesulfobacteriota bacterium]
VTGLAVLVPVAGRADPLAHPLALGLLAGACALPFWSTPEVIVDASRYFCQAKALATSGWRAFWSGWGGPIFAWTDLPLTGLLNGLVFRLLGEERLGMQGLNTAFLAGTVLCTSRLGRTLWDAETGFLAGLLVLACPFLCSQVPLLLADVPAMFFFTLAVGGWISALATGGAARIVLAGLGIAGAVLAKFSTWPMLSTLVVAAAVLGPNRHWRQAGRGLGALAVAGLLLAPAAVALWPVLREQLPFLASYQRPGLTRWTESPVSTLLFQTHPLLVTAALAGLARGVRRRERRLLIPLCPLLILAGLAVQRSRYSLPCLPMLALVAGYGLRGLAEVPLRRFLALGAAWSALVTGRLAFVPFLAATSAGNLEPAGHYLDHLGVSQAQVVTLPAEGLVLDSRVALPLLDLHTRVPLLHWPTPQPQPDPETLAAAPLRFTWEMPLPDLYQRPADPSGTAALVVIRGWAGQPLPPAVADLAATYPQAAAFDADSGAFTAKTLITVYHH